VLDCRVSYIGSAFGLQIQYNLLAWKYCALLSPVTNFSAVWSIPQYFFGTPGGQRAVKATLNTLALQWRTALCPGDNQAEFEIPLAFLRSTARSGTVVRNQDQFTCDLVLDFFTVWVVQRPWLQTLKQPPGPTRRPWILTSVKPTPSSPRPSPGLPAPAKHLQRG